MLATAAFHLIVCLDVCADQFTGVELDSLHSSVQYLRARLKRCTQSSRENSVGQKGQIPGRKNIQDAQIPQLKSSLAKLPLVDGETLKG